MAKNTIDASKIAEIAGVSRATVSRVINNYAFVKSSTRERVLKVITQYGYSPNFSAQILAGKRSNTIGLFLIDVDHGSAQSRLEDTHVNFMTERVIHTAISLGYYVLVYQVKEHFGPMEIKKINDMFTQSRIDGGIFVGFPNRCDMIEDLISRGFVAGVFNQCTTGDEANRIVVRLDYHCVSAMVDYIVSLGHRDIMFINGDMLRQCGVDVFQIYREALKHNQLSVREEYILGADALTKTHGIVTFAQFMEKRFPLPSCILCGNDIMAFGVIEVLRRYKLRVPEDISVIGSDDILVSQYFDPSLTTLRYDFDEMMKTLTTKVIECVENPFSTQFIKIYPGKIVERRSCISFPSEQCTSQNIETFLRTEV